MDTSTLFVMILGGITAFLLSRHVLSKSTPVSLGASLAGAVFGLWLWQMILYGFAFWIMGVFGF